MARERRGPITRQPEVDDHFTLHAPDHSFPRKGPLVSLPDFREHPNWRDYSPECSKDEQARIDQHRLRRSLVASARGSTVFESNDALFVSEHTQSRPLRLGTVLTSPPKNRSSSKVVLWNWTKMSIEGGKSMIHRSAGINTLREADVELARGTTLTQVIR